MGYDVYTKARRTKLRDRLVVLVNDKTEWQQVGANASLTAWPHTTVDSLLLYPMDVALAHYQTGDTQRRAIVWLLTFTEQSLYAGCSLRFGNGPVQLPLPFSRNVLFHHF